MALDLTNRLKNSFVDLVNDALEREDIDALEWLKSQKLLKVERKKEDGKVTLVQKSLMAIRSEYFEKYLGITPKSALSPAMKRDLDAVEMALAQMKKRK